MRDGEDALNERAMGRLSDRDEAEKGVDGGEASVSSTDAVVAFRFQVIEKRGNERSTDIGEEQRRGCFEEVFFFEGEKEAKSIAIRSDGVGASLELPE